MSAMYQFPAHKEAAESKSDNPIKAMSGAITRGLIKRSTVPINPDIPTITYPNALGTIKSYMIVFQGLPLTYEINTLNIKSSSKYRNLLRYLHRIIMAI